MNISDIADDYLIDVPIEIGTLSPQVKDRKEGMKKLTAGFLNEVMQLEAENQIQARPYEQTGKRRVHCNGTRSRKLKTIYGEIELDKPQIREFPFKTAVFERFSRVEEFSSDFYSPWPGPRSQAPLGPSLPTIRPSGPLVPAPHACVRPPARAKAPAWMDNRPHIVCHPSI